MDNKNIKLFITNNRKIINNNFTNKKYILIADRLRFDAGIRQSLISKVFNEKGYVPILATSRPNSDYHEVYKSFGIEKILNTNLLSNKFFILKNFPIVFIQSIFVLLKYSHLGFEKFKFDFKIQNIRMGEQIVDQYFRNDHSYMKGFLTFKFFKLLLVGFLKTKLIKTYIKKNNIKHTVASTDCYLNESSIIVKISEHLKILNVQAVRKTIKISSKPKDYKNHIYIVKKEDIKRKELTIKNVEKYLKNRFQGNVNHADVKNAFKNKIKNFDKKKFLKFFKLENKNYKKIILFAPHVFADCCSTFGPFPFLNYYNFFTETLDKMKNIKDTFWIVKPHPTRHFWNEDSIVKDFVGAKNYSNIFLCPDKISTRDLLQHVDTVVTGRGTVAVEAAIFGKKTLTCGASIYSEIDISAKTNTKAEFFKKLNFHNYDFNLNKNQILRAKKALYFMGAYRWKQNSNIIPNMFTDHKNLNIYFKTINQNLKKFNFLNDIYYLNTKKEIETYIT